MKKPNWTQILGIGGTVLGVAATLIGNFASEKKQEETIAKKVKEALESVKDK